MKRYISHIFIICLILCTFSLSQANPTQKITQIKDSLENKELNLQQQVKLVDTGLILSQKNNDEYNQAWFLTKKSHLYFMDAAYFKSIQIAEQAISIINPNIEKKIRNPFSKKQNPWKDLLSEVLATKGMAFVYGEQPNNAIRTFKSILDIYDEKEDSTSVTAAKTYNGMGVVFAYRNHYDVALNYFKRSLAIYENLDEKRGIYSVNSNIGSLYLNQGMYKESMVYFSKVQEIVLLENYQGDEPIYANFHLALAYHGLKDYAAADHFYKEAIRIANKKGITHLLIYLNNHYARNLYTQGRYTEAEKTATENFSRLIGKPISQVEIELLSLLGDIKSAQGDYRQANAYLNDRIKKSDSLEQQTLTENLLKQKYEFDYFQQENTRKNELRDLELAKTKITNRNLWIGVLSLCVIGATLAFFFFYRKFRNQKQNDKQITENLKLQNEAGKKRLETIEDHFSAQLDGKNKELASNALVFLRISSIGNDIIDRVKQLKIHSPLRGREKMLASEIEELAEQLAQNKGWGEFEFYFEQVDKDFLRKLSEKYPSLTPREKQICILFNLGLSNKEIASLSGKSLQSVGMAKFRLKKKMELDEESDIAQILQSL